MSEGKDFEVDFKDSCDKTNFLFQRIRDTAQWQQVGSKFSVQNPYDSFFFTQPFLWILELKSTKGSSISFFPNKPWERDKEIKGEKMVKPHQVKELMKANTKEGVLAGLVLNYRPRETKKGMTENKVFFIHIVDFIDFAKATNKSSINIEDCEKIGIEIEGNLKKVRYTYGIRDLIDRAVPFYLNKNYLTKEHLKKVVDWIQTII